MRARSGVKDKNLPGPSGKKSPLIVSNVPTEREQSKRKNSRSPSKSLKRGKPVVVDKADELLNEMRDYKVLDTVIGLYSKLVEFMENQLNFTREMVSLQKVRETNNAPEHSNAKNSDTKKGGKEKASNLNYST